MPDLEILLWRGVGVGGPVAEGSRGLHLSQEGLYREGLVAPLLLEADVTLLLFLALVVAELVLLLLLLLRDLLLLLLLLDLVGVVGELGYVPLNDAFLEPPGGEEELVVVGPLDRGDVGGVALVLVVELALVADGELEDLHLREVVGRGNIIFNQESSILEFAEKKFIIAGGKDPNGILMPDVYIINMTQYQAYKTSPLPFPSKLGNLLPYKNHIYYVGGLAADSEELTEQKSSPLMRYNITEEYWDCTVEQNL